MYGKQKKLRPKLDRRNAAKNIDYDASLSSSTSLPSSFIDDQSNRRTRSCDLYPVSEHTSFRIKGIDGEFDVICRSLGLSGPEDFAIPAAAWEARKQCSHHSDLYKVDTANELSDTFGNGVRVSVNSSSKNEIEVRASEPEDVKCGIKGSRPPRLAHPAPAVDNYASVWELVRDFGPADVEDLGSSLRVESNSDDSEGDERVRETVKNEEERNQAFVRNVSPVSKSSSEISSEDDTFMLMSEPALLLEIGGVREEPNDQGVRDAAEDVPQLSSESPSDDSNSLIPEPVYSDSPSGSLRVGIKSWQKGDFLGSGSFGTVHEGFTDDGFFFAVKEVSLLDPGNQGKQSIYQLEQEISLLSQFRHQNIVRYLGTDKVDNKLYIFLELVTKGSLASLYRKYHLRDSQVSVYTRQILSGLHYLHSRNVIHRDIKCANILVDASGSVKLADFGLAKAAKLNDIKSCKGTAFWMAPEVVNGKNNGYGIPADIWSLGCTVLEMLTGQMPYSHLEGMAALFRIGRGEPPPIPNTLSREAQDFIQKCLQVNPNDRPTAAELLEYPFVKNPPSTFSSPAAP